MDELPLLQSGEFISQNMSIIKKKKPNIHGFLFQNHSLANEGKGDVSGAHAT